MHSIDFRSLIYCMAMTCGVFASSTELSNPVVLDSGIKPQDVEKRPYLGYVRECVDLVIEYGTDRYGKVHSPILMNIIDVRDRICPVNPLPLEEEYRVTRHGRRGPAGANLYADQSTIRSMYALSLLTGDEKYSRFARNSLDYYLRHLVDEKG